MSSLPSLWSWSTLGEICSPPQYGWTTASSDKGTWRLVRITDIASGPIDWSSVPFCDQPPPIPEIYRLSHGDILIARVGASVGASTMIGNPEPAVFASYLIRFKPLLMPAFVCYFLRSSDYWRAIKTNSAGIAQPNVNANKLQNIRIPVPPTNEQRRIVEKLEALISDLDAAVKSLEQAREKLQRYRQAVLKAAVEGELTREWRETHVKPRGTQADGLPIG